MSVSGGQKRIERRQKLPIQILTQKKSIFFLNTDTRHSVKFSPLFKSSSLVPLRFPAELPIVRKDKNFTGKWLNDSFGNPQNILKQFLVHPSE